MITELERMFETAKRIWTEGAVSSDDFGFALEVDGNTLIFFSPRESSGLIYCRAKVASLDAENCPPDFAEALLQGNFFWTGTRGATLSFSEPDGMIYLTDRFDAGAFGDDEAFVRYVSDFVRTLDDWRVRRSAYIDDVAEDAGKEAE